MANKADLKRARLVLQAEQLRLKAKALELDEHRRAVTQERTRVIALLRMACERYGDNDWSETDPLDEILGEHLFSVLDRTTRQVVDRLEQLNRRVLEAEAQPRAAPPAPQDRPVPLRPTLVPETEHRCIVVTAQLRDQQGFRGVCICGFRTAFELTENMAALIGDRHVQQQENPSTRVGRI